LSEETWKLGLNKLTDLLVKETNDHGSEVTGILNHHHQEMKMLLNTSMVLMDHLNTLHATTTSADVDLNKTIGQHDFPAFSYLRQLLCFVCGLLMHGCGWLSICMCQTWTFRFGMHELHVVSSAVSHVEKQAEEMTLLKLTLNCQANMFSHQTLQELQE
jgi:hypothetical protein